MILFFRDLCHYPFLQYALIAAVLAAVAAGITGSLTVVRRSTYIAGAIAHCVLGGLGAARYFQVVYGLDWLHPMAGALAAALAAAVVIAWVTVSARERIDSVLSIVWALGMAVGISFIMKTPGYSQDLMSYLFGSILMVSPPDLILMAVLDVIMVVAVLLFYHPILAICFNEEAARVRGIPATLVIFIITIITAVTVVMLTQIVGIVLVIALLSIPGAAVSRFSVSLVSMMVRAMLAALLFLVLGLAVSYELRLPAGATIIQVAALGYGAALIAFKFIPRKKNTHE
jgi:zinc transport system permease protein